MATTIRTPIAGFYIDYLRFDDSGVGIEVINTVPESAETGVKASSTIALWVIGFSAAVENIKVYVTRDDVRSLAYDQAGTGIQSAYAGALASATLQMSPGASVNDELVLVLDPTTPFTSLDQIKVEVIGNAGSDDLDYAYLFTIEDTTAPRIDEVLWRNPRQARFRFTKDMRADALAGGTLYLQDISGAYEFQAPDKIIVSNIAPTSDWIGYWAALTGSAYPGNNGYFKVLAIDAATKEVQLDMAGLPAIKDDDGVDKDGDGNILRTRTLRGTVASYRIEARIVDETVIACAYEPIVTNVRAPLTEEIPVGATQSRYVIVDFHDDVSIERMYRVHLLKAEDDIGNPADSTSTFDFTTPAFGSPAGRVKFWDLIPEEIQSEDETYESRLEKLVLCLQDALNVLWYRADSLAFLNDPDNCVPAWVEYLLYSLGNPFQFPLTELEQRRLSAVLVSIYKQAGTVKSIQDTLAFFLGIQFDVRPFVDSESWSLGTSALGVTSILGPGTAYARNCYEIVSPVTLTDEQRRIVVDVATLLDPVYMHLLRIVEPGEEGGTFEFWTLGYGSLGETTILAI